MNNARYKRILCSAAVYNSDFNYSQTARRLIRVIFFFPVPVFEINIYVVTRYKSTFGGDSWVKTFHWTYPSKRYVEKVSTPLTHYIIGTGLKKSVYVRSRTSCKSYFCEICSDINVFVVNTLIWKNFPNNISYIGIRNSNNPEGNLPR